MIEIPAWMLIATVLGSVMIGSLIALVARGQKHVTIVLSVDDSEIEDGDDDSGEWWKQGKDEDDK